MTSQLAGYCLFEAGAGQTGIALVGHTGSGKSSIMNHNSIVFMILKKGRFLIDGQYIHRISRESLRNHMGIVLQDHLSLRGHC